MSSEHAARAWTDVFKRTARRDEPVASAPAAVADAVTVSKVFPRFLNVLAQRSAPVILDLGPVVGANVAFFGDRLSCKIHVEDLFADIEDHARRGAREALPAFLAARLPHPPASVDGVLCWDVFDFLDRASGQVLAGRLAALVRPGGVLHGSFGTTPVDLLQYTRCVIDSDDTLRQRPYPATPVRRQVLLTRDIMKMFDGLQVAESVLLKSNTRETLFRKG